MGMRCRRIKGDVGGRASGRIYACARQMSATGVILKADR